MKRRLLAVGFLALAAACSGENTTPTTSEPSLAAANAGNRSYIVVFKDNIVGAQSIAAEMTANIGTKPDFVYSATIRGFAARMSDLSADQLRRDPRVKYISLDKPVSIHATQTPTPSWGLDRIDQQNLPLNNSYTYPNSGAGVHLYGIDTGILPSHNDFFLPTNRMGNGISTIPGSPSTVDCNGHGTHTASTAAGTTYGVAKLMTIHPVRVLDCGGSGQFSWVIAGIDWVTNNHVSPAVANMSLGGGIDQATDDAVTASIAAGVTYSISAGNNSDFFGGACFNSPARTPNAITVAASRINDARASFSDTGPCVDIWAPGENITAAWIGSNNATNTISGTSMSAPHVAGAAALYLAANPGSTPAAVRTALFNNATNNKITGSILPGTPNKLLYMGFIGGGPGNLPPVADFSITCNGGLTCTFNGSASSDPDGSIVNYTWQIGNKTKSGPSPTASRTFTRPSSGSVTLTVTDNLGATASLTKPLTVPAP